MTAQAFTPEAAAETERKRRSRYPEAAVSTEPVRDRNYRADCLGEIPPGAAYLGFTVEAAFAQNGRPYCQRCGVAVWGKVVAAASRRARAGGSVMTAGQHGGSDSTVSPGRGVVDGLGLDLRTLARELAAWSARDDSQPQPEVREAASTALRAADRMLFDLNGLRRLLVTEIRYSDDVAAARTGALLREDKEAGE